MKTFWTTFYSYKGGVGRSLALANVAATLVSRGNKVVLLDFDLEAPSLDSFAEFSEAKGKPGIVEYVAEFERQQSAPPIDSYVHPVHMPDYLRGKLWIMPAGRKDSDYSHALSEIRWAQLYDKGLGAPFIENWKLSIEQTFHPDYVLIDSRTGLTEVGGVCTTAFPDLVVMMFGLNDQNVQGTATVARHIREANLERSPQMHFVATPIPNLPPDKDGTLMQRLAVAEKALGMEIGQSVIHYWAPAALAERLFALDNALAETAIVRDHVALANRITKFNRNGLDFLTVQAEDAMKNGDASLVSKLSELLVSEFPERAESLYVQANLARYLGRHDDALRLLEEAFVIDPAYEYPLDLLLAHHTRIRQDARIEEILKTALNQGNRISPTRKIRLSDRLAQHYMASGKYELAASQYKALFEQYKGTELEQAPVIEHLRARFNTFESFRRSGRSVKQDAWLVIIKLFETTPTIEGQGTVTANRYEAMHIPYALTGAIEKAKECLHKSRRLAATLNEVETVFTVRDYRPVSPSAFIEISQQLLAALDKGELWDGTKLHSTKSGSKNVSKPQ